ncbi:MAG: adenylate kinase [Porphyromonadaceae bacterium]|nr:adenylate kinase [Porphyromonadaceae bacterium]
MESEILSESESNSKKINIIICGAPGSGKGTQSAFIIEKYNLQHVSTGELLRQEIAKGNELGKKADALISNGQLVPDDMIIHLLEKKIDKLGPNHPKNGIILDGFPRTVNQAEALENLCSTKNAKIDILIDLEVDDEELIKRILNRGKTSGRNDDNLETIRKRLDVYNKQTKPVLEFYKNLGKYVGIDGMGTMEEIFERISKAIDEIK